MATNIPFISAATHIEITTAIPKMMSAVSMAVFMRGESQSESESESEAEGGREEANRGARVHVHERCVPPRLPFTFTFTFTFPC